MSVGGISDSLVNCARAWVGHLWGGLGMATILACMVFSAICGSSVATAMAVGAVTIPAMVQAGYDKSYAMGVTAAGGTLGILIPPSIPLILYGFMTEQSVRALFTAALVPGLLATGFLIVGAVVVAKIRNYPVLEATSWEERWVATRRALPSMLLPVLILGGIYTGAYTPTEAAVISVVYAVIISQVFYARISFRRLLLTIGRSILEASLIMVILATAMMLGHYLTIADIGTMILDGINAAGLGRMGFLLLIMGALLILGTFMEVTSMLLIMMTVLLPALIALDINTIHFAVLFVVTMEIGLLTPPVGMNLFVVARSGQGSLQEAIKGVLPFVGLLALLLVMLIFVPQISLWLPAQMP
jgi:C4-dicarboxylate transporter DctM subunit